MDFLDDSQRKTEITGVVPYVLHTFDQIKHGLLGLSHGIGTIKTGKGNYSHGDLSEVGDGNPTVDVPAPNIGEG